MSWRAAWKERCGPCFTGGGSSSPSQQTVTTTQQIPAFEQQFAQENQDLARSLGSQPYPLYQAPLVAPFAPAQQQGQQAAIGAAESFQPALNQAINTTGNAISYNPAAQVQSYFNSGADAVGNAINQNPVAAGSPANPGVIQSYMSPFVQAALAPQVQGLQEQLGQQQKQIDAQATGANAFGDARQGAASSLANFYGNQSLAGLLGSGYNTAYNNALQTAQQQQQLGIGEQGVGLQGGQALANIGANNAGTLMQEQGIGLQGGAQLANLAGLNQNLGLTGANAIYNVGQQQQQLEQQQLNTAYQQYQQQVQWPYQQLNTRLSALSNSPYNMTSQVTLPNANMAAQNLGSFASLAGGLGSLFSGSGSSSVAPFGGSAYNPANAKVG